MVYVIYLHVIIVDVITKAASKQLREASIFTLSGKDRPYTGEALITQKLLPL